ncbi:hypothetical protein N7481_011740 [Penicillium waksmanii]|uniref:uncharacterized protein n=1 Tax=Penicillium waksmanii TaxID=69791 RepID=UPI0025495CEF|nr:uncharacterized protein N7481_011740 [Penicillium waksmanii]KAJ5974530.1 hypothetical protein N7481_011740 [Penicillium waksmanii]
MALAQLYPSSPKGPSRPHVVNLLLHITALLWLLAGLITTALAQNNFGPLTTPFALPSSCAAAFLPCELCTVALKGQGCGPSYYTDDPECWPLRPLETQSPRPRFLQGFYSPGVSCPVGYTSACQVTHGGGGGFTFDVPPSSSETAIGCCPSDFSCTNVPSHDLCGLAGCGETSPGLPLIQKCVSTAQSTDYKGFVCFEGKVRPIGITVPGTNTYVPIFPPEIMTIPLGNSISTATSSLAAHTFTATIPSISVFAPLIQLVHQGRDVTGSSTSTAGAEKKKEGRSSLSTGAKAGIGIGSVIGGLVLVGAIFLLWSRRRQNNWATNIAKGDSYVRNLQNYEFSSR